MARRVLISGQRVVHNTKPHFSKERELTGHGYEVVGFVFEPIVQNLWIRDGSEELITLSETANCQFSHKIKTGSKAYRFGSGIFVCEKDYNKVPTLKQIKEKYGDTKKYSEIVIE